MCDNIPDDYPYGDLEDVPPMEDGDDPLDIDDLVKSDIDGY